MLPSHPDSSSSVAPACLLRLPDKAEAEQLEFPIECRSRRLMEKCMLAMVAPHSSNHPGDQSPDTISPLTARNKRWTNKALIAPLECQTEARTRGLPSGFLNPS